MFDFLKGGKVTFTFTLDQPSRFYRFGDTVRGKLVIENQNELKIQEGRIALVFKEESQYRYESTSTDSDGDERESVSLSWQKEEHVIAQSIILHQGSIPAKSSKSFEFSFAIPANAAPTIEGGKIVRAKWFVKATLSRKMASDYNEPIEIPVYDVAPVRQPNPREFGNSNEPGEAEMTLRLPGDEWAMGETIAGELVINPKKSFDATEVRVELGRTESVPRDKGNQHYEPQAIKLAGGIKLQPGQTLTHPFRLTVPSARPPTMQTSQFSVTWKLSGILARRFRGDTSVQVELQIRSSRGE